MKNQTIKTPTGLALIIVCLLGTSFYFYETLLEVAPSAMVQGLMSSFHVDGTWVGVLDTAYFFTYALMQLPGGSLLDRFGGRRMLTIAALSCGVGLSLLALTHNYTIALLSRCITGFGGSFGLMGAMYLINKYIPRRHLAFGLGLAITLGLSGGLLENVFQLWVNFAGWRTVTAYLGITGFALMVLYYSLIKDKGQGTHTSMNTLGRHALGVIKNFRLWPIALYGGLMYIPTGTLGAFWGIQALKAYFNGNTLVAVATLNGLIYLGWIIGSPIVGLLSDYLQKRRLLIIIGAAGVLGCLLLITYEHQLSALSIGCTMIAIGLFSSCSGLSFAMGCEVATVKQGGTTVGFVNMLAIIPSVFCSPLFGMILDKHWQGVMIKGARVYPWAAYQHAMVLEYGLIGFALLLALLLIKETYPHSLEDFS